MSPPATPSKIRASSLTATESATPTRRRRRVWIRGERLRQATFLIPARLAVRILPMAVFEWLGRLVTIPYRFAAMHRKSEMRNNLRRALGPEAAPELVESIARQYYTNAARHWMDNLILEKDEAAAPRGSWRGKHHLDEAIARGKGVILLGVHCFADRPAKRCLKDAGYPALSVRAAAGHPLTTGDALSRYLFKSHTKFLHRIIGDEISNRDSASGLAIARRLRQGGLVSVYLDGSFSVRYMDVPFLGGWRNFPLGLMDLIHITRCAVVPVFFDGDIHQVEVTLQPAVEMDWELPRARFGEVYLPRLVRIMEEYILAHPARWYVWPQPKATTDEPSSR